MKRAKPSTDALISTLNATAVAWSASYWVVYMSIVVGEGYGWDWKRPDNAIFYAFLATVQITLTGILVVVFAKVYKAFFKGFKRRPQSELCSDTNCAAKLFVTNCSYCKKRAFPLTTVSFGLLAAVVFPLASVGTCRPANDTGPVGMMSAAAIIITAALILWSIACWLWNR